MTHGVTWGEGDGSGAVVSVGQELTEVTAADQSTDSTSFVNITGLSFPVAGSTSYALRAVLFYKTSATTEACDFALDGPAGPSAFINIFIRIATSLAGGIRQGTVSTYGTGVAPVAGPGTSPQAAIIDATFNTPVAGGTVTVQFQSETGAPESVTVLEGSYATLRIIT